MSEMTSGLLVPVVIQYISKLFVVIAGSFAFSLISVQLRSHMSKWSNPGVTEPLDATAVLLTSTMHATSLSTSSRIRLHSSDLYLCHLSSSGETKLFTSCSRLPPSIYISAHDCCLPSSAHLSMPSQMRLAGSLCRRELEQQWADRRTDKERQKCLGVV